MKQTKVVPSVPGVGNTKNSCKKVNPCKHWCFTYNNYSENTIKMIMECCAIKRYSFQEEKGKNGTPHLQGYVEFKKKVRPLSVIKENKFHWEVCRNINASVEYCGKADTRNGRSFIKGIRRPLIDNVTQYRDWQLKLVSKLSEEPNWRDINWICDFTGNSGKTHFARHWCMTHRNEALYLTGKAADMKFAVATFCKKVTNDLKYVLIDLSRTIENFVSYQGIEDVKNGILFNGKYESEMVIYNTPHVVIFSNFEPEKEKLSEDRWKITYL